MKLEELGMKFPGNTGGVQFHGYVQSLGYSLEDKSMPLQKHKCEAPQRSRIHISEANCLI